MSAERTILVVGRQGQVARELLQAQRPETLHIQSLGRPDIDLAQPESLSRALDSIQPTLVVNAAAYTAVDQAESEEALAFSINADGVEALATTTAARNIPMVHLSTDYVFDGTKEGPYTEDDEVRPLGAYGRSKRAGEVALADRNPRHLILRTAWVYSPFGKNFVKTMLRVASERHEVGVVDDQIGNPTSARDIAAGIIRLIDDFGDQPEMLYSGMYHYSGRGAATWADVAERLFERSAQLGGPSALVRRIGSEEYPTPVKRPANSQLDNSRFERVFSFGLPDWQNSVDDCVEQLLDSGEWTS
jgi:dTDP-4-dehydrorhamnose reductase